MPSTANAAQLATVSYLDGLNGDGTVAAQSFADWVADSTPATYLPAANLVRKWFNGATGTPLAPASRAGTGGGTVTYAFDPADAITDQQRQAFVATLALWADEANIGFALAPSAASADVLFSVTAAGGTYELSAPAFYAVVGSGAIPSASSAYGQATIVFDNGGSYGTLGSFGTAGGYGVSALTHEVGHLLGLGHPGPYDDSAAAALAAQGGIYDSRQWSVMSYIQPDDAKARYYGSYTVQGTDWQVSSTTATAGGTRTITYDAAPETPMMLDILAIQQLYGTPVHTALSGGQVFGFNCNVTDAARPFFDFTQNATPVVTLWDAGTGNTLDLSGFAAASQVNLNPGTFSSAAGLTNNIGIAFGTVIDTAVGGAGDDTFTVNGDSDTLDGGGGTNTAIFPGARMQYSITASGKGETVRNTATGVTDVLTNIQRLVFSDGTYQFPASSPDPLFDAAYYLAHNPDVAAAGVDPYQHYLSRGWKEGRDPSALFSERYYLNQNPDVAAAGVNPLLHFEASGWREGRDPSALFSDSAYLAHNPDVAKAGMNPLLHYVLYGAAEGRAAFPVAPQDPLVNASFVDAARPDVAAAGVDVTAWFHMFGWREGTNPDALFDVAYYLRQNPDVAAAHVDPLLHYEQLGWHEGRNPSAQFSTLTYLAHNPDVAATGINPLVHYVLYGQGEGRTAYPV